MMVDIMNQEYLKDHKLNQLEYNQQKTGTLRLGSIISIYKNNEFGQFDSQLMFTKHIQIKPYTICSSMSIISLRRQLALLNLGPSFPENGCPTIQTSFHQLKNYVKKRILKLTKNLEEHIVRVKIQAEGLKLRNLITEEALINTKIRDLRGLLQQLQQHRVTNNYVIAHFVSVLRDAFRDIKGMIIVFEIEMFQGIEKTMRIMKYVLMEYEQCTRKAQFHLIHAAVVNISYCIQEQLDRTETQLKEMHNLLSKIEEVILNAPKEFRKFLIDTEPFLIQTRIADDFKMKCCINLTKLLETSLKLLGGCIYNSMSEFATELSLQAKNVPEFMDQVIWTIEQCGKSQLIVTRDLLLMLNEPDIVGCITRMHGCDQKLLGNKYLMEKK